MKIRQGFVSNSSSSSFIVRAYDAVHGKDGKFKGYKNLLTKKQIKALVGFGFFKTFARSPGNVECRPEDIEQTRVRIAEEKIKEFNYGYDVTCNQDEVFQFLLKNQIPFVASEHYGHRHVFYDDKTDKVTVAINFGEILSMYGVVDGTDTAEPIQTYTRKQYLKQVSW